MNGVPMSPNLLSALSQTTGQQTPQLGLGTAPSPMMMKMISNMMGTGMGNPNQMAAAQSPQYMSQTGM